MKSVNLDQISEESFTIRLKTGKLLSYATGHEKLTDLSTIVRSSLSFSSAPTSKKGLSRPMSKKEDI